MSGMKLGLGLYRDMLDRDHMRFARQCGCTHLIIHLANYYSGGDANIVTATDATHNYGVSTAHDPIWQEDSLRGLQRMAAEEGLEIYGIENFDPADWYDVLLDGPRRAEQMENLKAIIRRTGRLGIRAFGYNFSLAGVWGHQKRAAARGGATSTCFDASLLDLNAPIPNGQVWNMTYAPGDGGFMPPVSSAELWDRLKRFLDEMLPVAEEAGVELALHPDDPPMPELRCTPRMVCQPSLYDRLISLNPSPANMLEFCMGSLQEMTEGNLYDEIDHFAGEKRISYVHFRNVRGKVPCYDEVFLDEGDIDMLRALSRFQANGFEGVLIPDHTPLITCRAPWYAGMSYALGYMRAAFTMLDKGLL